MAKSTGRSSFRKSTGGRSSFGRRGGTVTVIEDRVQRSYLRNAKIAFWVIGVITALLSATVLADNHHPIVALVLGALIGAAVAFPIAAIVAGWPLIRVLWWWTPEIITAVLAVYGWILLANHTTLPVRLAVVGILVGIPAGVPYLRNHIKRIFWCVITRHRVRACFAEFIIGNTSGNLPLILWARPTPVGERVWIWLRPGLSLSDLEARLDKIAVACWASTVTAERASESNSAYLRLDIKRRNAFTGTIGSPLVDLVDPDTPTTEPTTTPAPAELDLPDVPAAVFTSAATTNTEAKTSRNGAKTPPAPVTTPSGADVSDWI